MTKSNEGNIEEIFLWVTLGIKVMYPQGLPAWNGNNWKVPAAATGCTLFLRENVTRTFS
jgi:hypothetical protein